MKISKKIDGNASEADKGREYEFTLRLGRFEGDKFVADTSIKRYYGGKYFEEGELQGVIQITPGSLQTITGLPRGLAYEVREEWDEDMD